MKTFAIESNLDVSATSVYEDSINQIYIKVTNPNQTDIEKKFEDNFPECNAIMVYGKKL